MPPSLRKTAATTAAAEQPSTAQRSATEIEEEEFSQEQDQEVEDNSQGSPATLAIIVARLASLEGANNALRARVADQAEVIDTLKTAGGYSRATAEEKRAAEITLLQKYPCYDDLREYWPKSHLHLLPAKLDAAAKPSSLEMGMEQNDRTYQRLAVEKKDGQKADYVALTEIYTYGKAYTSCIDALVREDAEEDVYEERYARFFAGLHDVFGMVAKRFDRVTVKTHPEDFDDTFLQVLESDLNQDKVSSQLVSPHIASVYDNFVKLRTDKALVFAAKQSAQSKTGKGFVPRPAGEKPLQKRTGPARKKPEERPAPQA